MRLNPLDPSILEQHSLHPPVPGPLFELEESRESGQTRQWTAVSLAQVPRGGLGQDCLPGPKT